MSSSDLIQGSLQVPKSMGTVLPFERRKRKGSKMSEAAKILSRAELLSGNKFRTHEVPIGVGGKLLLKELTAEEWVSLSKEEQEAAKDPESAIDGVSTHFNRVCRLICRKAVDSDGNRIFEDGDEEKIRSAIGASTLVEIYRVLARLGRDAEEGATPLGG